MTDGVWFICPRGFANEGTFAFGTEVDYTMDADAVDETGADCLITWPLFDDWYRHESRNTMCDWADIKRIEY